MLYVLGKKVYFGKISINRWQPTDNVKPVALIKKRLAGNQTVLAYLRKVKAFDSYVAISLISLV